MAHRFRHLTFLAIGLLLFWRTPLPAQPAPPGTTRDDRSFTVYAPAESPWWDRLYYLQDARPPVKLVFQKNRRSTPIKITGAPKPLSFGIERIDPATRKKSYVPVAETALPGSAVKTLVVFTLSNEASPRVEVVAVDDGPEAFPLRSIRLFNTTGVTLLGKAANFQGEVPPGISPAYPYSVKSEDPSIVGVLPIAFAINEPTGGARFLYNGQGDAWPLGRSLVFLLPPVQGSTDLRLRVLVDAPASP